MATKKATKKAASKKGGAGTYGGGGIRPLYGIAIEKAIAKGDPAEMRKLATQARKYLKDVQGALKTLDKKVGKAG